MSSRPCDQCPWRLSNQGKKHKFGFYTKKNLQRLWNELRNGGKPQSCHLTDPSHEDHVAVGAKPGAAAKECPGSVILILREMRQMADATGNIEDVKPYLRSRKKGLTKTGILYWCVKRVAMAGIPFFGGEKLPEVDEQDEEVGLPAELRVG